MIFIALRSAREEARVVLSLHRHPDADAPGGRLSSITFQLRFGLFNPKIRFEGPRLTYEWRITAREREHFHETLDALFHVGYHSRKDALRVMREIGMRAKHEPFRQLAFTDIGDGWIRPKASVVTALRRVS